MESPTNLADDRQNLTRGEEGGIILHFLMYPSINDADSVTTTDNSQQSVGARGRDTEFVFTSQQASGRNVPAVGDG